MEPYNDLDTFFQKKKKTKKGQSKLIAGDLLEQKKAEEEERTKRAEQKKKASTEPVSHVLTKTKEDEDWEDFEEEKELDMSKMRIGNLAEKKADSVDSESKHDSGDEAGDVSDGEGSHVSEEASAPAAGGKKNVWGSVSHTSETMEEEKKPEEKEATETEESAPKEAAKYIPPSKRAAAAGGPSGGDAFQARRLPRRIVHAPNVGNVEEFPSLADAASAPPPTAAKKPQEEGEKWITAGRSTHTSSNAAKGGETGESRPWRPSVPRGSYAEKEGAPPATRSWQSAAPRGGEDDAPSDRSWRAAPSRAAPVERAPASEGSWRSAAPRSTEPATPTDRPSAAPSTGGKYVPPARRAALEKDSQKTEKSAPVSNRFACLKDE